MQRAAALIINSSRTVSFLLPSSNTAMQRNMKRKKNMECKAAKKKQDATALSKAREDTRAVTCNLAGGNFLGRWAVEHCAICERGTFVAGRCRREV